MTGTSKDFDVLNEMGYKQELKREFSAIEIFAISFAIMSLVPSVASILPISLAAGGAGMTWGWLVPCFFIFSIGLALSELASALPTAGGLYYWTFRFAPPKMKRSLSFLCGYADTLGLIAGVGSINYGFSRQLLSCPALAIDGYVPTKYHTYAVVVGGCVTQGIIACLPTRWLSKMQWATIGMNVVAILLICIALPVGLKSKGGSLNSGSFVFGNTWNATDWEYGMSFLLSWMAPIWSISSHDACIHMSEEASNATVAVPFGILLSIGLCSIGGFVILAILAAVMNPDISAVLDSPTGSPMAQIIQDSLSNKWAIGMMALFAVIQWFMSLSALLACSRQTWAFARDGCLPFSRLVRKVTGNGIPMNAVIFDVLVASAISLLILVNEVAATAIFSLAMTSINFAWALPVALRTIWFKENSFKPGPFYMGDTLSRINGVIVTVYSIFVCFFLTMMPSFKKVDPASMNYTCVIVGAVWGGALIYYFVDAHKWYHGPAHTTEEILEGTYVSPQASDSPNKGDEKMAYSVGAE